MRLPTSDEVRAQVAAICASDEFARTTRPKELLRYLINETLKHPKRNPRIKGVTIGIDVFGLPPDFDPKKDTTVKVAMGDLRERLKKYYEKEGCNAPVLIHIPSGVYVPTLTFRETFSVLELDQEEVSKLHMLRRSMDERQGHDDMVAHMFLRPLMEKYPDHPELLSFEAMRNAVSATYDFTADPRPSLELAESLIQQVRNRNAEPWECTVTDAWIAAVLHWDWEKADHLFGRAIAANVEAKTCHCWYPYFLASQLKIEEAEAVLSNAVTHSAFDRLALKADLAFFQIVLGKLDAAEKTLSFVLPQAERENGLADFPIGFGQAALLHAAKGEYPAAIEKLLHGSIDFNQLFLGLYTLFLGLGGYAEVAQKGYDKLKASFFSGSSLSMAFAALGVGDEDQAVNWLIRGAVVDRTPWAIIMAIHPLLRSLHHHVGFRSLIQEKMKLPFPE